MSKAKMIQIANDYERILKALTEANVAVGVVGTPEDADRARDVIRDLSGRECGDCTLCCTTFPNREQKRRGMVKCEHACGGCAIYDSRPNECRAFMCFWLLGMFRDRDRPDRMGVVFDWVVETTSVAHEVLGPSCMSDHLARATATDLAHAMRGAAKRTIDMLSRMSPVLVHAGDPAEARLVLDGNWLKLVVIDYGDDEYTYLSPRLAENHKVKGRVVEASLPKEDRDG